LARKSRRCEYSQRKKSDYEAGNRGDRKLTVSDRHDNQMLLALRQFTDRLRVIELVRAEHRIG
jgi:hypothetical protein